MPCVRAYRDTEQRRRQPNRSQAGAGCLARRVRHTEFAPQYSAFMLGETEAQAAMDNVAAAWELLLQNEPAAPAE